MATYLVGYDLHPTKGETYDELIEAVKVVGTSWWHCLDSTWLVISSKSAETIRNELQKYLKSDDQLLVAKMAGTAGRDGAWAGFSPDCSTWLSDNL